MKTLVKNGLVIFILTAICDTVISLNGIPLMQILGLNAVGLLVMFLIAAQVKRWEKNPEVQK